MIDRLLWLIYAHAIGDMALQGPWIATYKNWHNPLFVNGVEIPHYWLFVLSAHALICGACVAVAMRKPRAGVIIAVSHFFIDFSSSNGMTFVLDQGLHLLALVLTAKVFGEDSNNLREAETTYQEYYRQNDHRIITPTAKPMKKNAIGTAKA